MDQSPRKDIVFISCGQFTEEERTLGVAVVSLVKELTPFEPYFAEEQSSFEGLTQHVFNALNRCVGFVGIMHHRGIVSTPNGSRVRASVWIEQEIAVAAFLNETLGRQISVAAYMQEGIALEGVREKLLLNPKTFTTNDNVLDHLRMILPMWRFSSLDVVSSLTDKDNAVLKSICEVVIKHGWPNVGEQKLLEIAQGLDLSEDGMKDVLRILESRGYTTGTWMADESVESIYVTPSGFEKYARRHLAQYESIVRSVMEEIVERGANISSDIAKSLSQPHVVIKYILSIFGEKGYARVDGMLEETIWISEVALELRRMLPRA